MNLEDYIQYFRKHRSSMDLCFLLRTRLEDGITASYASKELGLAIQTATNALRDLERARIVRSKKIGRERFYYPYEAAFPNAIDESFRLLQQNTFRGRHFPLQVLLFRLGQELSALAKDEGLHVVKDVRIPDKLTDIRCHFQIKDNSSTINTILIWLPLTQESILALLGRAFQLARAGITGRITIVLLFIPGMISFWESRTKISEEIESIILMSPIEEANISKEKQKPKKIRIIEDYADANMMLMPSFATKLATEVWKSSHSKK